MVFGRLLLLRCPLPLHHNPMTTTLGSPAHLRDRVVIVKIILQSEETTGDTILTLRPLLLKVDMIMTNLLTVMILDHPDHSHPSWEEENQGGEADTIMPLLEITDDSRIQVVMAVHEGEGERIEVKAGEVREEAREDRGQDGEAGEEGEAIE